MNSELRDKTLFYFTATYPYGNSPQWKKNELVVLKRFFRRIVVVPLTSGEDAQVGDLIEGIEYMSPIVDPHHRRLDRSMWEKWQVLAGLIRTPVRAHFMKEILAPRVLLSRARLTQLVRTTYEIGLFARSPLLLKLFESMSRQDSVAYFYWGIGQVNALLLKNRTELPFSVCRFHGWDLYEERHETAYIPYRKRLLELLDISLPCSENGRQYMEERWGPLGSRSITARLGTASVGRSELSHDGMLKIVSCSHVVEVKQLDLLCEALIKTPIPIRWTHIGDGPLMPMLRDYVDRMPGNVEVDLRGVIPAAEVPEVLASDSFDLFVNTSRSEGVPVSIMEALAAGIPVLATDVGGTSEIVDDSVGQLIPSGTDPSELAMAFEKFFLLDEASKLRLRDSAFKRFSERCDAETNAEILADAIANAVVRDSGVDESLNKSISKV
jgi:glycosyltransferase involved in cell wall biosynthesis